MEEATTTGTSWGRKTDSWPSGFWGVIPLLHPLLKPPTGLWEEFRACQVQTWDFSHLRAWSGKPLRRRRLIYFIGTIRRQSLSAVRSKSSTLTWFFQDDSTPAPLWCHKGHQCHHHHQGWMKHRQPWSVVGAMQSGLLKDATATVRQRVRHDRRTDRWHTTTLPGCKQSHTWQKSQTGMKMNTKRGERLKSHTLFYECRTKTQRTGLKLSEVTGPSVQKCINYCQKHFSVVISYKRKHIFIVSSVAH